MHPRPSVLCTFLPLGFSSALRYHSSSRPITRVCGFHHFVCVPYAVFERIYQLTADPHRLRNVLDTADFLSVSQIKDSSPRAASYV